MKHVIGIVTGLFGLALAGCVAREVQNTESLLSAAGFRVQPANTPAQEAFLDSLPPRRLVLVRRDSKPAWIYTDPRFCHCLYIGGAHAYQAFEQLSVRQRIAETELQAAQLNSFNYTWGPWPAGPFGPYDPWAY